MLGWTADQWDEGMAPSCPLTWTDLSSEQVAKAKTLAYDSSSWNWDCDEAREDDSNASAGRVPADDDTGSDSTDSGSSSDSDEEQLDEFGRMLSASPVLATNKPIKFTLKGSQPKSSLAASTIPTEATEDEEQATWWSGDGVWETRVAEDSEDEPFRYEFTTAADGTVSIVRLDGEDKVDEGTASFDGDMLDAEVFGGQFSAEIHDDGATLVWSDGDEWSRVSTRRKAVAPRRRLLSKAGSAAVLNPVENLPTKPIVVASPVPAPSFPKAATPSFSFTPAPAAAVMPATSCQPVFSFSSSASKTAAPVFSFPDIPVTPAAVAPATLSAGIPTEGSGSIGDHRSAGNDQEEHVEDGSDAADACDDPPATADAEADEAVVPDSYEQQLKTLVHFYATYESAKSESECRAILDKRKGDADAMTTLQFSKLCTKLSTKYGTNPMDMMNKASQQSSTASAVVGSSDTDSKTQTETKTAAGSLQSASGWNATKTKQADCAATWACEVCLVKNTDAAILCVACETCKPGCEEDAAREKEQLQKNKEQEMAETMQASAATVAAAGISFGLAPSSGATAPTFSFAKPASSKSLGTETKTQSTTSNADVAHMDEAAVLEWLTKHVRLDDQGMQIARKAFLDNSITGAMLKDATMKTLKSKYGISSWGVRLKIQLGLTENQEQTTLTGSSSEISTSKAAEPIGTQTQRTAAKMFSPVQSPRSALTAIRVN